MADNFNISDVPESAGPKSVEVPGDIADGGEGEMLSWDAAGVAALVPQGAAGNVLTANASGVPTFQAGGGGATTFLGLTDTPGAYTAQSNHPLRVNFTATGVEFATLTDLVRFGANDAVFPAVDPAGVVNRNDHSLITFNDSGNQRVLFEGIAPQWYSVLEAWQIILHWTSATAVVGTVRWILQMENLAAGGQDLDVDGFSAGVTSSPTAPATAGVLNYSTFSMTNAQADLIAPGNEFRLRVERDGPGGTMVGDAQLRGIEIRMA